MNTQVNLKDVCHIEHFDFAQHELRRAVDKQ